MSGYNQYPNNPQGGGGYNQYPNNPQGGYSGGGGASDSYYNSGPGPNSGSYDQNQGQYGDQDGPTGERGVLGALAGGAAGAFGGHKIGGKVTGHSKTSAVVGALAGAFAGHKMQDAASDWKEGRDEKKEEERRKEEEYGRRRRSRSRSRSRSRHGEYTGGFSASSKDINLETYGDFHLRASCKRRDRSYQSSTISLNQLIENDRGSFRWASPGGHGSSNDGPRTVTVRPGDTLRNIAADHGCSWEEIARHNGIPNPDLIHPGQVLQLPGGGGRGGHHGSGNFSASARDVRLVDGQMLEAELQDENGRWRRSTINLDERIRNDDGVLRLG